MISDEGPPQAAYEWQRQFGGPRASRLLDDHQLDSVVRGYLLIPSAIKSIVQGDPAGADAMFVDAAAIARRFNDDDLASTACHGRGRALIRLGRIRQGAALLDEVRKIGIAKVSISTEKK